MMSASGIEKSAAVILCPHVASGSHSILMAVRTEPVNEADSGWQFLCNVEEDLPEDAQVWSVSEVLQLDPSLRDYINAPPGTTIMRESNSASWKRMQ